MSIIEELGFLQKRFVGYPVCVEGLVLLEKPPCDKGAAWLGFLSGSTCEIGIKTAPPYINAERLVLRSGPRHCDLKGVPLPFGEQDKDVRVV